MREINVRACSWCDSLVNRMLSLHVFWTWCIDRFRKCRRSETLTFGAGHICDAFWFRETCRDPPFTAERPFLTEADVDNEHGGASFVTGRRRTLESRAEGQHTHPTQHVFTSGRFQVVGVAIFQVCMNTQRTTSFVCSPSQKRVESQMIMNEGG